MSGDEARRRIVEIGRSLFERRLTPGRTGNLSARIGDEVVITPTGTSLGSLQSGELAVIGLDGEHRFGPKASKEGFLHLAMYRARPEAKAVVHLHSRHAVAVSCLADIDPDEALPPLTAYFEMRVGRLPVLPYFAPGDSALGPAAERAAADHHALLLANHGPVAAAADLDTATDAIEEIEETAALYLLLRGQPVRMLDEAQVRFLRHRPD